MQALSVDGIRQVYHVAGRGPVCVAHSGGPGIHWAYLRSPELEERFTMVYLEPVGTGESGRLQPPPTTIAWTLTSGSSPPSSTIWAYRACTCSAIHTVASSS